MGTAGLTLLLFTPLAWIAGKAYQNFNNIQQNEFRLRQLSDQITYYDEVLTMSARMNAATADHQWEERYHAAEPKLEAIIQESIQLARSVQYNAGDAEQPDAANVALIALETQSFALVQQGQPAAAAALLNGNTYAQWKAQYAAGVSRRNAAIQAHLTQKIVLSLRNFSRLDEAELKVVNLHEGLESTMMILQHRLQQTANHGSIRVIKQYGTLPAVSCYPGLLNQVLMNLVANAIDAVAQNPVERPPQIIIQTLRQGEYIHIGISDNGSGISSADQKSLFNPFFTTKPVGEGTGLGLSISYKIITEQHAGKIWLESTVNQGTTFWIELPNAILPNVTAAKEMISV
jgi:signal transduction histidine kinase